MGKGYGEAGASWTKRALKGFTAQSGNPIEDIDLNNKTMRQRARILYMAAPVATASINTNRTSVVGSGLRMRCAINREILGISPESEKEWQKRTEAEFRMWAENKRSCDALGINDFYDLQQVALKSWLTSGDVFALFKRYDVSPTNPYSLRIHLIEADRVSTPLDKLNVLLTEGLNRENGNKIHDGVEVDHNGRVVAYHVCNVYPGEFLLATAKWTRVEAVGEKTGLPNIIQIMEAERPDQYRGVSYLAPVIEALLQQRRYTESELTAALIQSFLTAWITSEAPDSDGFSLNETGGGPPENVSYDENEYEMGAGQINILRPGESVVFGEPKIPTAGFEVFMKTICRLIGSALELPYDVLLKEFNSSYSASRGALQQAWEMFKMRRSWFVNDFCQPIYETWLTEAVARGRIKAPGFFNDPLIRAAWSGARWDGPVQAQLDPVKEASANETLVAHGWKTNEQVTREYYGGNWQENVEALGHELELFAGAVPQPQQEEPSNNDNEEGDEDDEENGD